MEGEKASVALKIIYDEVLLAFEEALDEAENIAPPPTSVKPGELTIWLENATTSLISWAVDTRANAGSLAAVEGTPLGFEVRCTLLELQQQLGGLLDGRSSRCESSNSASTSRASSSNSIQDDHAHDGDSIVSMSGLVGDLQDFVRPIRMVHASKMKEGPYRNLKLQVDDIYNRQIKHEMLAGSRTYEGNPVAAFGIKRSSREYDSVGDVLPLLGQGSIAPSFSRIDFQSRRREISIKHDAPTENLQQPIFKSAEGTQDYTQGFSATEDLWGDVGTALRNKCQEDSYGACFITPTAFSQIMSGTTVRRLLQSLEPLSVQLTSAFGDGSAALGYSKVLAICLYARLTPLFFCSLLDCLISDHQLPVGEDFLQLILSSLPQVIDKKNIQRFCAAQWVFLPVQIRFDQTPIQDQTSAVFPMQWRSNKQAEDFTKVDTASLGLGLVTAVLQTYKAVTSAYDVYLSVKEFPTTYRELHTAFMVERYRLESWGEKMLSDVQQQRIERGQDNLALWKLFQAVFDAMWAAFQKSSKTLDAFGHVAGVPKSGDMSDLQLLESMQLSVKSPPKRSVAGLVKTIKFVVRDKKKMQQLVKELCYWNDSLNEMISGLEQASARRRLRVRFSTGDVDRLQQLQAAAALLQHRDLEEMASARTVIEKGYWKEETPASYPEAAPAPSDAITPSTDFRLEMNQLDWQGLPCMTDQTRALAIYKGESIIVDWHLCRDDNWRRQNLKAFRERTENLTKVLNSNLKALNVGVLHCVGYLDQSLTITGYAFRAPSGTTRGQKPTNLYQLLSSVSKSSDVPSLGDRFELAKALVSTVFEILNLGWLHRNIQPKNVLFWPKPGSNELDYAKPYLVGFDISRPNQPGEVSEKPLADPDDDIYRHPLYRAHNSQSFLPSFDMYSLGIMLFEIGLWRNVGHQGQRRNSRPNLETHNSDPHFIEKVVMNGPVMDLKRHMGAKYRDAVTACLSQELDSIWDPQREFESPEARLQCFQTEVLTRVVDAIAMCSI